MNSLGGKELEANDACLLFFGCFVSMQWGEKKGIGQNNNFFGGARLHQHAEED